MVLSIASLPYDAFISLDAIGRTLLRMLVTRKRLLEWQTSSEAARIARADLAGFYGAMWIAPALAAGGWVPHAGENAGAIGVDLAAARSLAGRALDRLVDQPADRTSRPLA